MSSPELRVLHKKTGNMQFEIPQYMSADIEKRKELLNANRLQRIKVCIYKIIACAITLALFVGFIYFLVYYIYRAHLGITYTVVEPFKNEIVATVTGYTSSVDETDDTPFLTASGETTRHGIVACPSRFEFGTVIEIEGTRYECKDRMNKRYRDQNRFDIWFETKTEARNWGVKEVVVAVYD